MNTKYFDPLRILSAVGRRSDAFRKSRVKSKQQAHAQAWIARAERPLKINIGCGNEPFDGWTNMDADPTTKADILWDVTEGLPFPNDSCSFIYCEHFLEHIPVQDGVRFLAECHRSLQKGGVVRIGMPSAQEIVSHYYENVWASQPWLQKYGYGHIKTGAEYVNVCFRDWGHQWLYDMEELERRLREAGFTHIESVKWGESRYPELSKRETRIETLLICEATK
ncbi:MAG TPA: methyltransferase domain-containing protein [Candidatus Dormibacteraeota bacterium]|nr:methyltransferase domain-containing protein [Candidatus Dormibacteraeota bacterium]